MNLPFTTDQFFSLFSEYNQAIWPFQLIIGILAVWSVVMVIARYRYTNAAVAFILAFFWLWMGIVYHLVYFSTINPAAYIFGILFNLQGLLFVYLIYLKKKVSFRFRGDLQGWTGIVFMLFALLIYPLIGYVQGHIYPASPTFGLPCPTTIFTFGILLWTERKVPIVLLIIPLIWSGIGFMAALSLGVMEDISLLISGLVFAGLIVFYKGNVVK